MFSLTANISGSVTFPSAPFVNATNTINTSSNYSNTVVYNPGTPQTTSVSVDYLTGTNDETLALTSNDINITLYDEQCGIQPQQQVIIVDDDSNTDGQINPI